MPPGGLRAGPPEWADGRSNRSRNGLPPCLGGRPRSGSTPGGRPTRANHDRGLRRSLPVGRTAASAASCGTRTLPPTGRAAALTGLSGFRPAGLRPVAAQVVPREGRGGWEVPARAGSVDCIAITKCSARSGSQGHTHSAVPAKGRGTCTPLLVSPEVSGDTRETKNSEGQGGGAHACRRRRRAVGACHRRRPWTGRRRDRGSCPGTAGIRSGAPSSDRTDEHAKARRTHTPVPPDVVPEIAACRPGCRSWLGMRAGPWPQRGERDRRRQLAPGRLDRDRPNP